jgi:hypothetical protein
MANGFQRKLEVNLLFFESQVLDSLFNRLRPIKTDTPIFNGHLLISHNMHRTLLILFHPN